MNTPETAPADEMDADVMTAAPPAEPSSERAPAADSPAPTPKSAGPELGIAPPNSATMDLLSDVQLDVTVELGSRKLTIGELQRLAVGSVLELDTLAGDPLKVYANGRLIATGEAVVVDGQFGVRIGALSAAAAG